jgi:hypothetical protein
VIEFLLDCARVGFGVALGICVAVLTLLLAYFVGGALATFGIWLTRDLLRKW